MENGKRRFLYYLACLHLIFVIEPGLWSELPLHSFSFFHFTLFTDLATQLTQSVYKRILELPFIWQLTAGTLPQKAFLRYMAQDALYLTEYARALAYLAAKAPTAEEVEQHLSFAQGCLFVERALHNTFLAEDFVFKNQPKGQACTLYTRFLVDTCATAPYAVGMAAVLPCFKLYTTVGHYIALLAIKPNPYQSWIDTYSDPTFDALTEKACQMADEAYVNATPEQQMQMLAAYQKGAEMEERFWAEPIEIVY